MEALHARCELLLLRLLERAVRVPARGVDAVQPAARPAIHRATATRRNRRLLLGVAVAGNLGVLGYFKYYDFFISSMPEHARQRRDRRSRPTIISITLPVGISFFTFQALSYVIDIYRRQLEPTSLIDFAVYVSFFPHVVAGPIVRAAEFLPAAQGAPRPAPHRREQGVLPHLPRAVQEGRARELPRDRDRRSRVREPERSHSALESLVAIYGYAVQIYCDFSGYTDMAIGLALLLGFRFPQNFDAPVHVGERSRTSGAAGT